MPVKAHLDPANTERAKDDFLAAASALQHLNPGLLDSWRRSQIALGSPDRITDIPQVPKEELDGYLMDMFQAPLDRFAEGLHDTGLGLLLADSRGQILQRWTPDRNSSAHFDRVGTMPRSVLAEDVVGTNGVGTVIATGKAVQIHSSEHFAEFFREAICTGTPIRHPLSGRLMGVVTLSTDVTPRSDLLRPLISSLSAQLEQHVLELAQPATRRMFDLFLRLSRGNPRPVVAIGPQDVFIPSSSAGSLTAEDRTELQQLCSLGYPSGRYPVELSTGTTQIELTALGEGNNVITVLEATPKAVRVPAPTPLPLAGRSPEWLALTNHVAKLRDTRAIALIVGEPGVGKTSLALGSPAGPAAARPGGAVIDAAESHVIGRKEWLQLVRERLNLPDLTVVKGVETLAPQVVDGLRSLLENSENRGAVFLTLSVREPKDAEEMKCKFGVGSIWIPPLRERFDDFAALWHVLAQSVHPGMTLSPAPATVEVLRAYTWPGNAKELKSLIGQLAAAGRSGPVMPEDLPGGLQLGRNHTRLERVELEAIQAALREAGGNRAKAAEALGISRATIYRKMKAYKLTP